MNKLGFGFLHLPMTARNDVDYSRLIPMVDVLLNRERIEGETSKLIELVIKKMKNGSR